MSKKKDTRHEDEEDEEDDSFDEEYDSDEEGDDRTFFSSAAVRAALGDTSEDNDGKKGVEPLSSGDAEATREAISRKREELRAEVERLRESRRRKEEEREKIIQARDKARKPGSKGVNIKENALGEKHVEMEDGSVNWGKGSMPEELHNIIMLEATRVEQQKMDTRKYVSVGSSPSGQKLNATKSAPEVALQRHSMEVPEELRKLVEEAEAKREVSSSNRRIIDLKPGKIETSPSVSPRTSSPRQGRRSSLKSMISPRDSPSSSPLSPRKPKLKRWTSSGSTGHVSKSPRKKDNLVISTPTPISVSDAKWSKSQISDDLATVLMVEATKHEQKKKETRQFIPLRGVDSPRSSGEIWGDSPPTSPKNVVNLSEAVKSKPLPPPPPSSEAATSAFSSPPSSPTAAGPTKSDMSFLDQQRKKKLPKPPSSSSSPSASSLSSSKTSSGRAKKRSPSVSSSAASIDTIRSPREDPELLIPQQASFTSSTSSSSSTSSIASAIQQRPKKALRSTASSSGVSSASQRPKRSRKRSSSDSAVKTAGLKRGQTYGAIRGSVQSLSENLKKEDVLETDQMKRLREAQEKLQNIMASKHTPPSSPNPQKNPARTLTRAKSQPGRGKIASATANSRGNALLSPRQAAPTPTPSPIASSGSSDGEATKRTSKPRPPMRLNNNPNAPPLPVEKYGSGNGSDSDSDSDSSLSDMSSDSETEEEKALIDAELRRLAAQKKQQKAVESELEHLAAVERSMLQEEEQLAALEAELAAMEQRDKKG